MRFLHSVERTLQPGDDVGFGGDALFHFLLELSGHFRAGDAEQIEICERDVHVDFAGGAHAGRGTPGEFVLRRGLGQVDQLLGDVLPLAVIPLPDSFRRGLTKQRTRNNQEQQQNRLPHTSTLPRVPTFAREKSKSASAAKPMRPFKLSRKTFLLLGSISRRNAS